MRRLILCVGLLASGCGDDPCQELQLVCDQCPTDGDSLGIVAGDSCKRTVESNDADACQARIDQGTYSALGCGAE